MGLAMKCFRMNAHLSAHRRPRRPLAVEVETLESRSLLSVMAGGTATPPPPGVLEQLPDGTQGYYQWGQSFQDPPQLVSRNGVLKVTLVASQQTVMIGGKPVVATVYNGSYVGPTLRVRPGDTLIVTLVNHLNETTNLHFHGLHVSPSGNADNVLLSIPPGQSFRYVVHIPKDQASGTYWYHSHDMMQGEEQVFGGMSGAIIVDGLKQLLPPGLRHITEHTFDLKDFQVDDQGQIVSSDIDSGAPTTRTVNGQIDPVLTMRPGETQLWRLANVGADIFYDLHLGGNVFHVIAEDGHPVNTVWTANDLLMPPGKRYDVLVQAGAAGVSQLRTLGSSTGPGGDNYPDDVLATIVTQGAPERPARLPQRIKPFHDLQRDKIAASHTLVFSENPDTEQFFINSQQFDSNRVDVVARLGTTQEWTIVNTTDEQHPFHLHTDPFQVVSINGQPYQAHSYQDTVVLPAHGEVQILIHSSDFTGTTVFHCHIMHHEENGMMGVLRIV
jgi:FtsP/CotA-like multicopper oxidase with cupredoxin domain